MTWLARQGLACNDSVGKGALPSGGSARDGGCGPRHGRGAGRSPGRHCECWIQVVSRGVALPPAAYRAPRSGSCHIGHCR